MSTRAMQLALPADDTDIRFRSDWMFGLAIVTMLVQSVVVSTSIKGLLIPYLLILAQFGKDTVTELIKPAKLRVFTPFLCFLAAFAAYEAAVQIGNLVTTPILSDLVLVSLEEETVSVWRSSLFTQGLYLVTCVLFFLYLLRSMQISGTNDHVMRLARIGLLCFLAFGIYESVGYFLTGENVDFISNRLTGDYGAYSTFQTLELGGLAVPRIKSLAGEASMFAFSVVPFAVLFYYMKQRIWMLLLAAALLSTSTTGYIGVICFLIMDMIMTRRMGKLLVGMLAGVLILWAVGAEWVSDLTEFAVSKFKLEHMSGIDRMDNFSYSLSFFANSDPFHMLFGYGFGYVRSTDGFTTLLVNVGVVGTVLSLGFLLYPFFRMKCNTGYRRGLFVATVVEIVMILLSVTEFFYLHIWFIAALAWFEYWKDRRANLATLRLNASGTSLETKGALQ